jgi:hypothetical protein
VFEDSDQNIEQIGDTDEKPGYVWNSYKINTLERLVGISGAVSKEYRNI